MLVLIILYDVVKENTNFSINTVLRMAEKLIFQNDTTVVNVNEPGLNVMLIKIPNWLYLSEILLETDDFWKADQDYVWKRSRIAGKQTMIFIIAMYQMEL